MKVLLPQYKYRPSFAAFRGNTPPNDDLHIEKLQALKDRLRNAQLLLGKMQWEKKETDLLEIQIGELLEHIAITSSILKSRTDEADNEIKNSFLYEFSNDSLNNLENETNFVISELYKRQGIETKGRDIVVTGPKQTKKPLSFELSDKKYNLDEYQQSAIDSFRQGNTVLVTAPTGTGKTLIAEHIIDDIIKSGKKVIYTTPLKALCNDKYKQFSALWGDYDEKGNLIGNSKVGLATGDVKINVNAPLVVMTTEIYRNMLVQQSEKNVEKELKNVEAVIFDEFHYMGDVQRGSVWEESVMFSPKRMKILMLSATISNATPLSEWMSAINDDHGSVVINVPEDERHVPLKHFAYIKSNGSMSLVPLIDSKINADKINHKKHSKREQEALSEIREKLGVENDDAVIDKIFSEIENRPRIINSSVFIKQLMKYGIPYQKAEQYALILSDKETQKPNISQMEPIEYVPLQSLITELNRKKMTPALYFTYSKKKCKELMQKASDNVGQLLTPKERQEIAARIARIQQKGIFLGTDFDDEIKPCLLKGFAMHHSGMMPQCKSFIEELGRSKLVKVCFATDTLGAGINFPFKTVVFSDFEKYGDFGFDEITVNEFKQGAGRAGRRGIDDIGYVISIPKEKEELILPYNKVTQNSDEIQSSFNLSYGLILSPRFLNNSIKVLSSSFDSFQTKSYDAQFRKSMLMLDILKERKLVEQKNGKYHLTPKGKIASKTRGINEILISEILTNSSLMENISPADLAGLISMFAPDRDEKIIYPNSLINKTYNKKVIDTIELAKYIRELEINKGIESNIKINNSAMELIKIWANTQESDNNAEAWINIIEDAISNNIIKTEGDFLKKINYTTNILKQIQKIAPTPYIKETAAKAIKMLQKSPVNDILLYELDYKDKDEQI